MIAPAAPPVAPAHRYGTAQWVKVYKTELDRDADLVASLLDVRL